MFAFAGFVRPLFLLAVVFLLAACGGGDSSSSSGPAGPPGSPGTLTITVSATAGAGGSISPTSQTVEHGAIATFMVTPEAGYSIETISGCDGSLDGNDAYTTRAITGPCTVEAVFLLNAYTVSAIAGTGGDISPTSRTATHGATAAFTISPETGYSVDSVSGCGGSLEGNTYTTGTIISTCVVTASFTPGIAEVRISPVAPTVPLYTTLQLNAVAIYVDGSSQDITGTAAWSSSDVSVATMSTQEPGLLETEAEGQVTITARLNGKDGATVVSVGSPQLISIVLSDDSIALALGESARVTAEGHYAGDVNRDITQEVTWVSGNQSIATVSTTPPEAGRISTVSQGSTMVTASLNGLTESVQVSVSGAALAMVNVEPSSETITQGATLQLSALATYTDGSEIDVTTDATWASDNEAVIAVGNEAPNFGRVAGVSSGFGTISALIAGFTGTSLITVLEDPNAPKDLTLRALPNVILANGVDSTELLVLVRPNDSSLGVIVDGTRVDFSADDGRLTLSSVFGTTISGETGMAAVAKGPAGQTPVRAFIDGTLAEDLVTVRVVSSFATVIATATSVNRSIVNGVVQAGSSFSLSITNTSNRKFNVDRYEFTNGGVILSQITDPSLIGDGILEGGETIGIRTTLSTIQVDNGFAATFFLSDPVTGQAFSVSRTY